MAFQTLQYHVSLIGDSIVSLFAVHVPVGVGCTSDCNRPFVLVLLLHMVGVPTHAGRIMATWSQGCVHRKRMFGQLAPHKSKASTADTGP
jgi:hypothetical protein